MKYHTKLGHIALAEIKLLFCDPIIIFSLFFYCCQSIETSRENFD